MYLTSRSQAINPLIPNSIMSDTTSTNSLIVPVQLNACHVDGSRTVTDAKADFSRLPWTNGQEDFNSSTPFLGESVLSPPFQDKNFELAEGVHLHWVLPKALRTYPAGSHNPPAAPNRWLISGDSGQWIVESDYINENSTIYNRNAVTIPSENLNAKNEASYVFKGAKKGQPYVYLGRQMTLNEWLNEANPPTSNNYFQSLNGKPLSAFGYGELSFNTFYPNCRSVFGFFDPDGTSTSEYEVMGWYSESGNDIVQSTIDTLNWLKQDARNNSLLIRKICDPKEGGCPQWLSDLMSKAVKAIKNAELKKEEEGNSISGSHVIQPYKKAAIKWLLASSYGTSSYYKDICAQIAAETPAFNLETVFNFLDSDDQAAVMLEYHIFGIPQALNWTYTAGDTQPQSSLYYSYITLNDTATPPTFNEVAIGNTGTEALSAYLASNLGGLSKNKVTADAAVIEQGLNTLLLGSSVQSDLVDLDDNIKESHHNQGFKAIDSGLIWRIRKMKDASENNSEPNKGSNDLEDLPESVVDALNELNVTQEVYQKGVHELEDQKAQLYANWCKYMHSCYPPLGAKLDFPDDDLIKDYLNWEKANLITRTSEVGTLNPPLTEENTTATGLFATALLTAYNNLNTVLTSTNNTLTTDKKGYQYELSEVPAPRFYQPKDPVVLFATSSSDTLIVPSKDVVAVKAASVSINSPVSGKNTLYCNLDELSQGNLNLYTNTKYKSNYGLWSPQILQWLGAFYPETNGGNVGSSDGNYSTSFITGNFSMNNPIDYNEATFDFTPTSNKTLPGALEYSGSTYMSAHTQKHMQEVLEAYILKKHPKPKADKAENFSTYLKSIKNTLTADATSLDCIVYHTYKALNSVQILTQSLGGFNQALLQQRQNLTLPVKDPLGFSTYRDFTNTISTELGTTTYPSPDTDDRFMPVRAGRLTLQKLELLDYFGRESRANTAQVSVASSMQVPYAPQQAWLNPRFSQASRLNFRWLAAAANGTTDIEMNSHPASSPVCGWLLPNYFDNSLMVYTSEGNGLGRFNFNDKNPAWFPFPGDTNPVNDLDQIPAPRSINPHLLKVLLQIKQGNAYTSTAPGVEPVKTHHFLYMTEAGQASISPEYYAGHDSMAILMGKPMAVVRAHVGIETQGNLAHDQSLIPFSKQLHGGKPDTNGYEQVNFPVRLGENGQLNDGLLAFWEEKSDGTYDLDPAKWVNNTGTNTIDVSLRSGAQTLTMLLDPHGIVHASSGILPVKTIRIPADQYSKALKKIAVTFKIRPILTPTASLQLSLPQEKGFTWSWLEESQPPVVTQYGFNAAWSGYLSLKGKSTPTAATVWADLMAVGMLVPNMPGSSQYLVNKLSEVMETALIGKSLTNSEISTIEAYLLNSETSTGWLETPDAILISKTVFVQAWTAYMAEFFLTSPTTVEVWAAMLSAGWVGPSPNNTDLFEVLKNAAVVTPTMKSSTITTEIIAAVDKILNTNATGITPFKPEAKFYKKQQLMEGWLKIAPSQNS